MSPEPTSTPPACKLPPASPPTWQAVVSCMHRPRKVVSTQPGTSARATCAQAWDASAAAMSSSRRRMAYTSNTHRTHPKVHMSPAPGLHPGLPARYQAILPFPFPYPATPAPESRCTPRSAPTWAALPPPLHTVPPPQGAAPPALAAAAARGAEQVESVEGNEGKLPAVSQRTSDHSTFNPQTDVAAPQPPQRSCVPQGPACPAVAGCRCRCHWRRRH